jgi:hypothetical protein
MAADLVSRASCLTLEPADELVERELLGEVVGARGRSSGSGRRGRADGLSDGCSNRTCDGEGGVGAADGASRDDGRGRAGGGGRSGAGAGAEESRAGDGVVNGRGVGVEEDAGVVALVELSANDTFGLLGSGTGYLDVLGMMC